MSFKKMILSAGLLGLSVSAHATTSNIVFESEILGTGTNDTISTAQNLGSFSGTDINVFGFRLEALPGSTSVDYYKFDIASAMAMTFAVTTPLGSVYQNDSTLGLFNSNGSLLSADDDSGPGFDSLLSSVLNKGTYYLAVAGFPNFAFTGDSGSGNWPYTLTLSGSAIAPVPEPETYALMGVGLLGLLATRRKKQLTTTLA